MEIGGYDLIFHKKESTEEILLAIFRKHWPNMVTENDNMSDIREFFIYKDKIAQDAWDMDYCGRNNMFYIIIEDKCFSVVSDSKEGKIVDDIKSQFDIYKI